MGLVGSGLLNPLQPREEFGLKVCSLGLPGFSGGGGGGGVLFLLHSPTKAERIVHEGEVAGSS